LKVLGLKWARVVLAIRVSVSYVGIMEFGEVLVW